MSAAEKWITEEQVNLWHDLDGAIRYAVNTAWSMQCEYLARRIVGAARIVGSTELGTIPWRLEASGVYHALYAAAGIETTTYSDEEWERYDQNTRLGSRSVHVAALGQTVRAIQALDLSADSDS